jgi:hypothetical protein
MDGIEAAPAPTPRRNVAARDHVPDPAWRRALRWWATSGAWIPVVTIALLVSPLALTDRTFGSDWTIHEWLVWRQELNIRVGGLPSLFVSSTAHGPYPLGVFYPIFAFTGSTVYALGGYLAVALGDRPVTAYVLLQVLAFCLAFGGMTWLSRQVGLRGWRAQLPGVAFVTGTYYLTNLYGRGDFAEFFATSTLPLVVASTCALLTSPRVRLRHALPFVVALVLLTGSHNITLLWGATFLGVLTVVAIVSFVRRTGDIPWRRVAGVAGLGALAVGVNAWYLFPDLAYGFDTSIGKVNRSASAVLGGFDSLGDLLDPLFRSSSVGHQIHVQLPWLWLLVAAGAVVAGWRWCRTSRFRWLVVALVAVAAAYLALAVDQSLWRALPSIYDNTQFTWRLHTYVLLCTALLVMVALRFLGDVPRRVVRNRWLLAFAGVAVLTTGVGVAQAWGAKSEVLVPGFFRAFHGGRGLVVRSRADAPPSLYSTSDFRDLSARTVAVAAGRTLEIAPERVEGSSFTGVVEPPAGRAPFATNIATGTHFVDVQGLRVVGRTKDGFLVAARPGDGPASGPVRISIRTAGSAPIVLGRVISLLCLLGLGVVAILLAVGKGLGSARRRRSGSPR